MLDLPCLYPTLFCRLTAVQINIANISVPTLGSQTKIYVLFIQKIQEKHPTFLTKYIALQN